MNKKIIISALLLLPLTASAKWSVIGTPDGVDAGTDGDLQPGNVYEFGIDPASDNGQGGTFAGVSSKVGEWWVASNSSAPWQDFYNDTVTETQPSFHITDDINRGDSFFVGLSMEFQMKEYTSEFRIANNLFDQGTQIYFGLRNQNVPSVFATGVDNEPIIGAGGHISGGTAATYDKDGNLKKAAKGLTGLDFIGSSYASTIDATPLGNAGFDTSQFEWLQFETNSSTTDDIIFEIKDNGAPYTLDVTEWVAYFVLPEATGGLSDLLVEGEAWGDSPPADADALDDMVFSWTVDGKSGYTLTPEGDPLPNPDYTPEGGALVPEPSSVLMLLSGVSLMMLRRKRKAA